MVGGGGLPASALELEHRHGAVGLQRPLDPHPAPNSPTPTPVVAEAGDPRLQLRRETTTDQPESPARHGWRGWCNQTLGLSLAASPAERASRARRVRIQRPLETHRTVAVLQLKGGRRWWFSRPHL